MFYKVTAVGQLYKKSVGKGILSSTWSLRDFVLSGVHLIYYKNGKKRGEYDISGCIVRKPITPEEAKQPSAKYVRF